jgi:hypothetical protein
MRSILLFVHGNDCIEIKSRYYYLSVVVDHTQFRWGKFNDFPKVVSCGLFCCHWNKKGEVDSRDPQAMFEENKKPKTQNKKVKLFTLVTGFCSYRCCPMWYVVAANASERSFSSSSPINSKPNYYTSQPINLDKESKLKKEFWCFFTVWYFFTGWNMFRSFSPIQ